MKGGKAAVGSSMLWISMLLIGLSLAYGNSSEGFLTATPEQFDAGKVAEGKTIEATTIIQNTGNTLVEITNVRTS